MTPEEMATPDTTVFVARCDGVAVDWGNGKLAFSAPIVLN